MAVRITYEDSVRTVTAISLAALVAGSFLVPAQGAPTASGTTEYEMPWWHNPCDYNGNRIRHGRDIHRTVKNQLKTITNNFNTYLSHKIDQYCSKFENSIKSKQIKKADWLPSRKFFSSLSDDYAVLPDFHYQIQVHAATLHKLSNMHIESAVSSFDEVQRAEILNTTAQNMKSLLCEVETAMNHTKQHKKGLVPYDYVNDVQIPPRTNFTTGVIKDCSLLREYGHFLKRSYKKLSGKNGRKNNRKGKKAGKAGKNRKRKSKGRS